MTLSPAPADAPAHRVRRASLLGLPVLLLGAWLLVPAPGLAPAGFRLEVPVAVGTPVTLGLYDGPRSGSVTLRRVVPHVRDGADAVVRVLLCRTGGDPLGSALGTAEQVCEEVSRPEGATLEPVRQGGTQLVLEVTPRRAGTVEVDGVRLEYRAGLRRGVRESREVVVVRAP